MEMPTTEPTWVANEPVKDCTLGLCSMFCPQWCYIIFSPPPLEFTDDIPAPSLSPLVVAVIGIFASLFLLACYYTLASKYCRTFNSFRGRRRHSSGTENQLHNMAGNRPARPSRHGGLDDSLINKITICKYRKGNGLIDATDCSVCLSEFSEDEVLRLLPKCEHAFHVQCIDAWLKSHSNCPLCRAKITLLNFATSESSTSGDQQAVNTDEVSVPLQETEISNTVERIRGSVDTVVEIRSDDPDSVQLPIRPAFSSHCNGGFDRR